MTRVPPSASVYQPRNTFGDHVGVGSAPYFLPIVTTFVAGSHIPPFAHDPEETDSYENCSCILRAKRLEAYIASGARFYLAAHQHRLVVRGYRNLTILTGEAMCANFDMRPTGFRLFEVNDDFSYSWNVIAVE